MNVSPILLLSIGATFGLLYGLIITLGWAVTRNNRKKFHKLVGVTELQMFDLETWKALDKYAKSFSISNNSFYDENDKKINPQNHKCYIVGNTSPEFPKIKKGFLIFMNKESNKIDYAFDIPNLENYR